MTTDGLAELRNLRNRLWDMQNEYPLLTAPNTLLGNFVAQVDLSIKAREGKK